jgi:excisionase family DNA binding protein
MALLDVSGAAEYLGVTDRQVRDLWAKRKLTGVKVGRLVRFDRRDLDRFIEDNRHEAVR